MLKHHTFAALRELVKRVFKHRLKEIRDVGHSGNSLNMRIRIAVNIG